MSRINFIFLLTFLLTACGSEQTSQPGLSDDLVQMENIWMHAMIKRDQSLLNQVVASEFTVSGMKYIDSAVITRSVWMQNIMQDMKIDSVHFIKTKVNTIDDVGIVRAQFYWSGTYGEDHFSDTASFVDTWIKRSGEWRVISRIVTD